MKTFLSIFFFFCFASISFSQTYIGDIWLNSQADVDSFGAEGYTKVEGHLRIHNSGINDLSPLSGLTVVEGKLTILGNDNLTSLTGLHNLEKVTNTLWIDDNDAITSLDGLNGLDSVLNEFKVTNNANLTTFDGLQNLISISSHVTIENNESLINLSGLDNLGTLNGNHLNIIDNPDLVSINNFENTTHLYKLIIQSNENLPTIEGLNNLESANIIQIKENTSLESLTGLDNINSIGYMELSSNAALSELTGLENLNSINQLNISDHPLLNSLDELENINSLGGLDISYCPNLTSLADFDNITSLSRLTISHNNSLTSLSGLNNLTSINFSLWISNNENLVNLDGLNNLTQSYSIHLNNNTSLTSLNGLENLTLTYSLDIKNNSSLANYCALDSLIANTVINTQWPTLSYDVHSNLYNPTLQDLSDGICLDCINANPINNSVLTLGQQIGANQTGATYQWLNCDNNHAVIPNETSNIFTSFTYGNYAVEITYNGCVDTSACTTINTFGSESFTPLDLISISPNPTTGDIHINFGTLEYMNLKIYNQLGQHIYSKTNINQQEYTFNLDAPAGLYFIEVFDDAIRKQFKILKNE